MSAARMKSRIEDTRPEAFICKLSIPNARPSRSKLSIGGLVAFLNHFRGLRTIKGGAKGTRQDFATPMSRSQYMNILYDNCAAKFENIMQAATTLLAPSIG